MDAGGLLARAHAAWPASWISDADFLAHLDACGGVDGAVPDPAALHVEDLYLACACARGVTAALAAFERDHLRRIREFAAGVDGSPAFIAELTQQLRARLLVADGARSARIATYTGRGSLGGWLRVAAVRLARDLARPARATEPIDELAAADVDPELGYLKAAYGDVVSRAVQDALAALTGEPRTLLKLHYVDGLSIDQVGVAFGKSRATAARMLAAARLGLLAGIRERLVASVGVRVEEADSLVAFVKSRLDVSLGRALGRG